MTLDGVFTDNRVIVDQNGKESVICSRSDGIGLSKLRKRGIPMFVLSTETNPVVQKRCEKLKIDCFHGCENKKLFLLEKLNRENIDIKNVMYVGNDINDLECMAIVGYPIGVEDAYPEIKEVACLTLSKKGGYGAVRELCDLIDNNFIKYYDKGI